MTDKLKSFGKLMKLDSHHAIERFGVVFFAFVVCFTLVTSAIAVTVWRQDANAVNQTALYTQTFKSSKTGIGGDVTGVYRNPEGTRALVMLKFDDVTTISTDAANYQSFITGSSMDLNQQDIKNPLTGSILVFGTTGYVGVLLQSPDGFASQIMNLTMRANSELVPPNEDGKVDEDVADDSTFAKHDQWRVFFNPCATKVPEVKGLETKDPDMRALFHEIVVAKPEAEMRTKMDTQLATMRADLTRIDEYTKRLERTSIEGAGGKKIHVVAPKVPAEIAGDRVTCEPGTNETAKVGPTASDAGGAETPAPSDAGGALEQAGAGTKDAGSDKDCENGTLSLHTDHVLPGGYGFDWRGGSVSEGYLDEIVPEGESYVSFLTKQREQETPRLDLDQTVMEMSDGTFLSDYDSSVGPVQELNNNVSLLMEAYRTYFNDKQTYQVKDYTELLDLEVSLRDVEANHSSNTTAEAVLVY